MYADFKGLNSEVVTFNCNSTVTEPGQLVKLIASGMVGKCASGDQPIGVVENVRNGFAAVTIRGYINVNHDGTLNIGYRNISASDDKTVKLDNTNGIKCLVVETLSGKAGILL
ncbi:MULTISPECIES: hypothetical protein [unclassified Ruminococcus]|uniref:hypothetical protein n=1 Tax=unclassified Ruminococcus TaxID=2608920 RepID=UPI00210BEEE6|nr:MULTISPECIES: hypothetical protein [unclassified Ruminococcus]MCQ4021526.1 hypothetical protein [Ruminococcus sp. zg-924]MCQ4113971.1 hypothetical protein [Ruminococcus sp. zg-921]